MVSGMRSKPKWAVTTTSEERRSSACCMLLIGILCIIFAVLIVCNVFHLGPNQSLTAQILLFSFGGVFVLGGCCNCCIACMDAVKCCEGMTCNTDTDKKPVHVIYTDLGTSSKQQEPCRITIGDVVITNDPAAIPAASIQRLFTYSPKTNHDDPPPEYETTIEFSKPSINTSGSEITSDKAILLENAQIHNKY